jgi:hypothetical protein
MTEMAKAFSDPNCGTYDGEDRVMHVPFAASQVFKRRGGKAVDLHHRYQAAVATSSNLAGFIELEEVGTSAGRPATVADGDLLPVNMGLHKAAVLPTTGRVATVADVGKNFDIFVDGDNVQFVNMGASSKGVLRVSRLVTSGGDFVACTIPPDKRYGSI